MLSSKCRFNGCNGAQLWKEYDDDFHKPTFVCMSARFPYSVEALSTHLRRVQDAIASAFFSSGHQNEGFRVEVVSVEDISAGFSEIMVSFKIRVPDKNVPSEFPNLEAALCLQRFLPPPKTQSSSNKGLQRRMRLRGYKSAGMRLWGRSLRRLLWLLQPRLLPPKH